ncbi:MAG TPA: peptidylprolyl isomerase [Longilinea sp.]|nr:peptidylprolyl isomerase [Longilinea sp.]
MQKRNAYIVLLATAALLLAGCTGLFVKSTITPIPTEVPTPTATPEPLAASVNGEGITLAEYQSELQRFQGAVTGTATPVPDDQAKTQVLDDLIDQTLLEQGARKDGYTADDATLQQHIDALVEQLGSAQALTDWEMANFYTDQSFKQALRRQIAAAWERDKIVALVPTTADQVHARQILVLSSSLASQIYNQLKAGADFATLAYVYDPLTGGDLGWFPKGYLTQSAVEDAAFSLQPGQYSEVLQTDFGYQIIYVIERDANHSLSADALQVLQHQALQNWLQQQRSAAQVETLVP